MTALSTLCFLVVSYSSYVLMVTGTPPGYSEFNSDTHKPSSAQGTSPPFYNFQNSVGFSLFLDVPNGCDKFYDGLIEQLRKCKDQNGILGIDQKCELRFDFSLKQACNSQIDFEDNKDGFIHHRAVLFPAVGNTTWHPSPFCDGKYCRETNVPVWSSFPSQESDEQYQYGSFEPSRDKQIQQIVQNLLEDIESTNMSKASSLKLILNLLKNNQRDK